MISIARNKGVLSFKVLVKIRVLVSINVINKNG